MPRFFDTHSHIYFSQYDKDRDQVLARMRETNTWTIVVGTREETSRQAKDMAESNEGIWATIGTHPTDAEAGFESKEFDSLVGGKVVGVGECGLDYFRAPKSEVYKKQLPVFEAQLEFALKHDLPLMLHIRPEKGGVEAHEDTLDILRSLQRTHGEKVRGNTHFFTGPLEIAKQYWDLGFTIALPGVVTFASETHEVAKGAPLEMLLSETDAPYAAPLPHRGERNEPVFVSHVVEKIAELRGEDTEKVGEQLVKNGLRVFEIGLA